MLKAALQSQLRPRIDERFHLVPVGDPAAVSALEATIDRLTVDRSRHARHFRSAVDERARSPRIRLRSQERLVSGYQIASGVCPRGEKTGGYLALPHCKVAVSRSRPVSARNSIRRSTVVAEGPAPDPETQAVNRTAAVSEAMAG